MKLELWSPEGTRTVTVRKEKYRLRPSPSGPPVTAGPRRTVVVEYQAGSRELLLFEDREAGRAMPVGDEVKPVKINDVTGLLAEKRHRSHRSLIWSHGGTTYFLSDYEGTLQPKDLLAMARSIR